MLMIMWIRNRLINAMTGLKGGREREGTCGCKWIESLFRLWSNAMMMIELKAIRCLILWSDTCYGQGSSGQADSKSNQKKTRLIAFAPLFSLCRYLLFTKVYVYALQFSLCAIIRMRSRRGGDHHEKEDEIKRPGTAKRNIINLRANRSNEAFYIRDRGSWVKMIMKCN